MNKKTLVNVLLLITIILLVLDLTTIGLLSSYIQFPISIIAIIVSIDALRRKINTSAILLVLGIISLLASLVLITTIVDYTHTYTITEAISVCTQQMQMTCQINNGTITPTWTAPTLKIQGNTKPVTCSEIMNCSTCQECGFTPS